MDSTRGMESEPQHKRGMEENVWSNMWMRKDRKNIVGPKCIKDKDGEIRMEEEEMMRMKAVFC